MGMRGTMVRFGLAMHDSDDVLVDCTANSVFRSSRNLTCFVLLHFASFGWCLAKSMVLSSGWMVSP